jgi:hypothetical protein
MDERYSRPAITVDLTGGERMLATRALRSVHAPHSARRLLDNDTLWAFEAELLADWLDRAARAARPLSSMRRGAGRLSRRYRKAAYIAKAAPADPAEWPGAPVRRPAPPTYITPATNEAVATARWAVIPPNGPEEALQC